MASKVPFRIAWAVEQLAVAPSDCVLEIGCGRGVAAALICEKLIVGALRGIDRSAIAIEAATKRNAEHIAAGRVEFEHVALADARLPEGCFEKILAINVNLFWIDPRKELPVIRRALTPTGALYLFYEPPSGARLREAEVLVREKLAEGEFEVTKALTSNSEKSALVGIITKPKVTSRRER